MKASTKKSLYAVTGALLIALIFMAVEFMNFHKNETRLAYEKGEQTTQLLTGQISGLLEKIEAEAAKLGEEFGNNDFTKDQVNALIRQVALDVPEVSGITACYEPYTLSDTERLFCPYYSKNKQDYVFVEDSYDYTLKGPNTVWYSSIIENGAKWIDPYYGSAAQEWYIDYGVPFYYQTGPKKGQIRGIIDFSLEAGDFTNLIHKISVGKTGYAFISSGNNTFIAHPVADLIGTQSLSGMIETDPDSNLTAIYKQMQEDENGVQEVVDPNTGEMSLAFYEHIPVSGYNLGAVFFKSDLTSGQLAYNRRMIKLAMVFSALMLIIIALYFGRDILDRGEIECLSVLSAMLLFANIFFIGYLQHSTSTISQPDKSPAIVDMSGLGNFISQGESRAELLKIDAPRVVPTGIFIERMEFHDSYNLNLGGKVWQKYPLDIVDDVQIGFRLPQMSPFAESSYIEESYRKTIEPKEGEVGYLLVGWDMRVTLRLDLKYADYPFDKRHLDIEIVPADQSGRIMVVPDLASYSQTSPARKSGIDTKVFMPGNNIVQTYFNFSSDRYETDFGFARQGVTDQVPILHFNVHLKRKLLNAFVTYLIPIVVTLSLIYILILACGKTEARQGIIESMAAFFFVLIFSHIDLRKDVVTADLMFIEYFYFITYLMIILSTLNLITYTKSRTVIFNYNDNQIYRAFYFPIFFGLILVIMLMRFY